VIEVTVPTQSPFLVSDMARETPPDWIEGVGYLFLPDDISSPVPGVMLLVGLGGPKNPREFAYGRFLAANGHAALLIDTFATRKIGDGDVVRALSVTEGMMTADAFAGLRFLSQRPEVDPGRIFVAGFSYGGMVTQLTAYECIRRLYMKDDPRRFAGHVSYYGCTVPRLQDPTTTGAPILALNGELDGNVPLDRAKTIAEDQRRGGSEVTMKVFDDTYHQWDSDDVERRFVRFNLARCWLTIDRDGVACDEVSGWKVTGRASRALMLARRVGWSGYYIQQDREVTKTTNDLLLDFLRRHG